MSTDPLPITRTTPPSVHVPVALLGVALSIFLFVEIRESSSTADTLRTQINNAETNDKNLKDTEKRMKELVAKNEPVMKQAKDIFDAQEKFLTAVLDLSKDDDDAKKVVQKYGIQRNAPAEGAPATPAPADTAAPEKK